MGDRGGSTGEYTDVASAKRAARGVLISRDSSELRSSVVIVGTFLSLAAISRLVKLHLKMEALMKWIQERQRAKDQMERQRL